MIKNSFFLVATGGIIGSLLRYLVSGYLSKGTLSLGTMFVNISGCFILGLVLGLKINDEWKLFMGVGILGSFTTFSTFNMEALALLKNNRLDNFCFYYLSTLTGGLILTYLGYIFGVKLRSLM